MQLVVDITRVPQQQPEPVVVQAASTNNDQTLDQVANPVRDFGCFAVEVFVATLTDAGVAPTAATDNALVGCKPAGATAVQYAEIQQGKSITFLTDKISRIHFKSQTAGHPVVVKAVVYRTLNQV